MKPKLDSNSLCSQEWLWIPALSASTFLVLGLWACKLIKHSIHCATVVYKARWFFCLVGCLVLVFFFCLSPTYFLLQDCSLNLKLMDWPGWLASKFLGSTYILLTALVLPVGVLCPAFFVDPNSGPQACTATSLLTEPEP